MVNINNDLGKLINNLPIFLKEQLNQHPQKNQLIEIVIDLGRRPEVRFTTGPEYVSQKIISWQDIDYMTKRTSKFSHENRAGIERTLHRISCLRNRQYLISGFTCRIGRAIFGTISVVRDLLELEKSVLILGKPGVGKTTVIREIARILADEMEKRVIIVDTSNEIAGDSDIPHFGIGRARRMQVAEAKLQYQIMIEAVENHMPQIIIIDEIGTELEVLAAQTIAEKGVQLVGTTHGNCLKNLIKNPSLVDLIGGIQFVTLSDEEAKRRGTQKSILERKAYPSFEIAIEINHQSSWTIHEDLKSSIDLFLRKNFLFGQIRKFSFLETIKIKSKYIRNLQNFLFKNKINLGNFTLLNYRTWILINQRCNNKFLGLKPKHLIIYIYSLSDNIVREISLMIDFRFILTNDLNQAILVVGLKEHLRQNFALFRLSISNNVPIYTLYRLNSYSISEMISKVFGLLSSDPSRNPNRKDFE